MSNKKYMDKATQYAEKFGIIEFSVKDNKMIWFDRNLDCIDDCAGWLRVKNLDSSSIISIIVEKNQKVEDIIRKL